MHKFIQTPRYDQVHGRALVFVTLQSWGKRKKTVKKKERGWGIKIGEKWRRNEVSRRLPILLWRDIRHQDVTALLLLFIIIIVFIVMFIVIAITKNSLSSKLTFLPFFKFPSPSSTSCSSLDYSRKSFDFSSHRSRSPRCISLHRAYRSTSNQQHLIRISSKLNPDFLIFLIFPFLMSNFQTRYELTCI